MASEPFQNRLEPWDRIPKPGSKPPRCYARVLGVLPFAMHFVVLANIQEPYRTLSLQALDASIHWWKGKPAPRASALKAPWSLSPDLQKSLKQFLRQWHLQVLAHQVPCHVPSFKTICVNMLRFWISSATTNRPSRCGLPISTSSAAARIGLSTRKHPSIQVTLTGDYQDPYLQAFFLKNLPSLRRALF